MRRRDFHFDLPDALIAQYPLAQRSGSRLLHMDIAGGEVQDRQFVDLPAFLRSGDLLVFNDTRVLPARLFGHKDSGGRVEIMVERMLDEHELLAQLRVSKVPQPGSCLTTQGDAQFEVLGREGAFFHLRLCGRQSVHQVLDAEGHMPLPPYIEREDENGDRERYQTVYASTPGAVAAPTAGLHFDEAMLARLDEQGIERAFVTLHVGAGTFQPVRVDSIHEHQMHSEYLEVSARVCEQVRTTRARGGRVIAVGTTSVRCLETASPSGQIEPFRGETDIFITPGYEFRSVDALLTNFHMPESTLMMLVCAFGGMEKVMAAYRHAIAQRYRFFSYGDAMLMTRAGE